MEMIVTDMTRMNDGYIWIAGIDRATGNHVRPVTGARLGGALAASRGGVFDFRRRVDLGQVRPTPTRPQTEDVLFDPAAASYLGTLKPEAYFRYLANACTTDLAAAFGPGLERKGASFVVPRGKGSRSLAVCKATKPFDVYIKTGWDAPDRARALWEGGVDLALQDLRLYDDNFRDAVPSKVDAFRARQHLGGAIYLCFGLTRLNQGVHWLQLNSVHFEADPTWSLA